MIANFFRSLNQHRVEYLLISGQATVLYGAATFSEDIDLWIHPTEDNCPRFLAALRDCGVRYYKLTPPLTVEHLARGHGFHFVLPGRGEAVPFVPIGVHSWFKSQGEGIRPFDSDRLSPIHGTPSLLSGRSAHEILRFVRASAAFILRDLRKGK